MNPDIYHIDYETFSPADLKVVGAHRYAQTKGAEILMLAIARNEEGPYLWVHPRHDPLGLLSDPRAYRLMGEMARDPDALIYAHNANFEIAITKWCWELETELPRPQLAQWRCTMVLCRVAGLPESLEKAGVYLGLTEQKDARGKTLIRKFCVPKKDGGRTLPAEAWEDFVAFGDYCLQDVRTERTLHQRLKRFDLTGAMLQAWQFDKVLNDRGLPVNVTALRHAQKIIDEAMVDINQKFVRRTGLNATQRAKVQGWFHKQGVQLEDMQADTVTDKLDELRKAQHPATDALELYELVQFAAVKKVASMLNCVCYDGWIRGMFVFYGAGTGRWSARMVQPHNFKRPTVKGIQLAYDLIQRGCNRSTLDILWGNALEVISSCIRNFIQPHVGMLFDVDYAAIEARIVCWLSGQEDTLEEFRRGVDSYKAMAAHIYGCAVSDIQNPSDKREVGKRTVLGCGFNMGPRKFRESCLRQYGIVISEELSERAVEAYRTKNYKVAGQWKRMEAAAREAIARPGLRFKAGPLLSFIVDKGWLLLRLPSGRDLAYPDAKLEEVYDERFETTKTQITFYGNLKGSKWGRVPTYGGKLTENATQAVAADFMMNGSVRATAAGYQIVALIHDQAPALKRSGQDLTTYIEHLTHLPPWATGMPLKAEGRIVPYYTKG